MMVPYDACYITQEVQAAPALYFHQSLFPRPVFITSLFFFLSEWQLCVAHVVVGQPTEALLPGADVHSCPLSLLLPLRHGSADTWAGAGCSDAGSHRYVGLVGGLMLSWFRN